MASNRGLIAALLIGVTACARVGFGPLPEEEGGDVGVEPAVCGNGALEPGETCDDGDTETETACDYGTATCTSCNADCTAELSLSGSRCGDANEDPLHETCDDGNTTTETCLYGLTSCLVCDSTCHEVAGEASFCGDTITDNANSETCDDGNAITEICPYGLTSCLVCDSTCHEVAGETSFCGDTITDSGNSETCDDGVGGGEGACLDDCSGVQTCGDGVTAGTETCDDGPGEGDGACLDDCSGLQTCGDGATEGTELCDDGPLDSLACDYAAGIPGEACTVATCGDGYLNQAAGEECDDDNAVPNDGCDAGCQMELLFGPPSVLHGAADDRAPVVRTDGNGLWLAVWHSNAHTPLQTNLDYDILFSRSTDGETWDAPTPLNSNAADDLGDDLDPHLTNDTFGNWVAIWSSRDDLGGTVGTDSDIFVAVSTDDGTTWSAPAPLNSNAGSDNRDDADPRLATDAAGNWVAVWSSDYDLGGTAGTDFDILVSGSTDNGATWSAPAPLNTNAAFDNGADNFPEIATDTGGNWLAVWTSSDDLGGAVGTDLDILVARSTDNGATWSAAAPLNTNAGSDSDVDTLPALTTDTGGNWLAVWTSYNNLGGAVGPDADIFVSRSTDDGVTWSAPVALNSNAGGDNGEDLGPTITTDSSGIWLAAWESSDDLGGSVGPDPDIVVSSSTDSGTTWSAPVSLNSNAGSDAATDAWPGLTTDGGGSWLAVWYSFDDLGGSVGQDADIFVSRSSDDGANWSAVAPLNTHAGGDSGTGTSPRIATDAAGIWVAVWQSNDDLGVGAGTDDEVLVARSIDNGATWSAPAPLNTNAGSDSGFDSHPWVAAGAGGNWVAVWESTEDLGGTAGTDSDIFVARSNDGGVTWSAPAPLNTTADSDGSADHDPKLATDVAGNWVAVWSSRDDLGGTVGTDWDIVVSSSTDNGLTWSAPAPLNSNAGSDSGDDNRPQITTDTGGNWVAVWVSLDDLAGSVGTDRDVLVSRSSDNGATWTAPAALNTNAGGDTGWDDSPLITTDRVGAWVAVWESNDDLGGAAGTDSDILVARSNDNGMSWSPPAVLNSNADSDVGADSCPQLATDAGGNWVAVWYSGDDLGGTVGTDVDIFASVSRDGGATWDPPSPLATHAGADGFWEVAPRIASDAGGNWLATWVAGSKVVVATTRYY